MQPIVISEADILEITIVRVIAGWKVTTVWVRL